MAYVVIARSVREYERIQNSSVESSYGRAEIAIHLDGAGHLSSKTRSRERNVSCVLQHVVNKRSGAEGSASAVRRIQATGRTQITQSGI